MTKTFDSETQLEQIYEIPLTEIVVSDDKTRHSGPTSNLDELTDSIKKRGLFQPVVLAGEHGHPPYELVSGLRRYLAYRTILRKSTIRAAFAGKLSKPAAVIRSFVENLQRLDLSYDDTARG